MVTNQHNSFILSLYVSRILLALTNEAEGASKCEPATFAHFGNGDFLEVLS